MACGDSDDGSIQNYNDQNFVKFEENKKYISDFEEGPAKNIQNKDQIFKI